MVRNLANMRTQRRLPLAILNPRAHQDRERLPAWLEGAMGNEIETIQLSMLEHDICECRGCCLEYPCGCSTAVAACLVCAIYTEEMA